MTDTNTDSNDDNSYENLCNDINMNKIMEKLIRKYSFDNKLNLIFGYRLFSSELPNKELSEIHQKMNDKTLTLMASNVKNWKALDIDTMKAIHLLYSTHPKIISTAKCIVEKLFQSPFDVTILNSNNVNSSSSSSSSSNLDKVKIKESMKEKLIKYHWLPFLIDHHHWMSKFGICPFYFEPIILNSSPYPNSKDIQEMSIHYVPKTVIFETGVIFTFQDNNGDQRFVWKENDYFDSSSTYQSFLNGRNTKKTGSGSKGKLTLKINLDGSIPLNKKNYKIKKSRYMLFSVGSKMKMPTLDGKIIGNIAAIIPEINILNDMRAQQIVAGEKLINPEQYVETPIPNMNNLGPNELDKAKLVLEMERIKRLENKANIPEYSTAFGVPTPHDIGYSDIYSGESRQSLFDQFSEKVGTTSTSELFQTRENYNSVVNNLEKRNDNLRGRGWNKNSCLLTEEFFGINVSDQERFYTLYQSKIHGQLGDKEDEELNNYKVKALNNPFGVEAKIIKIIDKIKLESKTKLPKNASYLATGQKLVHGTSAVIPNYDIQLQYSKVEEMIDQICDFNDNIKNNFMNSSKNTEQSIISGNLLKLSFKSVLNSASLFIEQLWEMLIYLYLDNLEEKELSLNKIKNKTTPTNHKNEDDEDEKKTEEKVTKKTELLINSTLSLNNNNIKIIIDFTDETNDLFYTISEYDSLYQKGFIDEKQYYEVMSKHYTFLKNVPFSNTIKQRLQEKNSVNDDKDENNSSLSKKEKRSGDRGGGGTKRSLEDDGGGQKKDDKKDTNKKLKTGNDE